MATSRTGTGQYKRWRREVLRQAQRDGVTHCPLCGVQLRYDRGLLPESAEPDHIIPDSLGGKLVAETGRAICRLCNQRRGNGTGLRRQRKSEAASQRTVTTLVSW